MIIRSSEHPRIVWAIFLGLLAVAIFSKLRSASPPEDDGVYEMQYFERLPHKF